MDKLLHIIATPRGAASRTLKISNIFLDELQKQQPECTIDELNLFAEKIPLLTAKNIEGKYQLLIGKNLAEEFQSDWQEIVKHIERFKAADNYLISVPMWNFNIPYMLKQYIDVIVQPKHLFQYTDTGVEGLIKNKKMIVITSRGGDYLTEELKPYDFQEPYLRTIFGFIGITDIKFINAEPMDAGGNEIRENKIREAQDKARVIACEF